MKKEGRDLVKDAVADAKLLREAALEAARNEIIEGMAPRLRALLDEEIKSTLGRESVDRSQVPGQGSDYYAAATRQKQAKQEEDKERGENPMDDKKKDQELDMESLAGFFPQISEEPEADADAEPKDEAAALTIPTLGEEEECAPKDEEPVAEEIEIDEATLRQVYDAALKTEASVKKGFSDMTPAGELDAVAKDVGKGLNPAKSGEHAWEGEEPPAKQDFQVKEAILRGLAENKALRENLKKAVEIIKSLSGRLHEVNLFNSKVLHVNRILNKGRLTQEQKRVVMESIDKARTIDEVKMVYETVVSSFKAATAINEGRNPRQPKANSQRARTTGTPDQKVLSESVDRTKEDKFARFKELAGIVK